MTASDDKYILTINTGSATVKFELLGLVFNKMASIAQGIIEYNESGCRVVFKSPNADLETTLSSGDVKESVVFVFGLLSNLFTGQVPSTWLKSVGFRIVHGGNLDKPTLLSGENIKYLESISHLAPLHMDLTLNVLSSLRQIIDSSIPFFGVFDTAFHKTIPKIASQYPLPEIADTKLPLRKYGFHGLSHQFMLQKIASEYQTQESNLSLITLHLGSGCSICAISQGKSIDTSMGFTPLEGLMMRTRPGDIDPGIIFYLLKDLKFSISEVEELLYRKSGLKGISKTDGDMRTLEKLYDHDENTKTAVDMFVYKIQKYIGSYLSILPRIDGLVFGGGIAENSSFIRNKIIMGLKSISLDLDAEKNQNSINDISKISSPFSKFPVYVVSIKESYIIYNQINQVLTN